MSVCVTSLKYIVDLEARMSSNSVKQKRPARVPSKSGQPNCQKRVSKKCFKLRLSRKSVQQECQERVSNKGV